MSQIAQRRLQSVSKTKYDCAVDDRVILEVARGKLLVKSLKCAARNLQPQAELALIWKTAIETTNRWEWIKKPVTNERRVPIVPIGD